jgi:hypothetical protein
VPHGIELVIFFKGELLWSEVFRDSREGGVGRLDAASLEAKGWVDFDKASTARWSLHSEDGTMRRLLVAVLVLTLATGCTSLHSVRLEPAKPFAAIRVGDVVSVHTSDGRQDEFNVAQISLTEIVGTNGRKYQASEITRLQRRSFSGKKTTLLACVYVGVSLLFVAFGIRVSDS